MIAIFQFGDEFHSSLGGGSAWELIIRGVSTETSGGEQTGWVTAWMPPGRT